MKVGRFARTKHNDECDHCNGVGHMLLCCCGFNIIIIIILLLLLFIIYYIESHN